MIRKIGYLKESENKNINSPNKNSSLIYFFESRLESEGFMKDRTFQMPIISFMFFLKLVNSEMEKLCNSRSQNTK